jgi:ORF6N domain
MREVPRRADEPAFSSCLRRCAKRASAKRQEDEAEDRPRVFAGLEAGVGAELVRRFPQALLQPVIRVVFLGRCDPAHSCSLPSPAKIAQPPSTRAAHTALSWAKMATNPDSPTAIESRIHLLRGHRVMLDADLARLYGVEVRALNQAARRNSERFPSDFMFQLTWDETAALRSQTVILENAGVKPAAQGRHAKYRAYAFTEQGVAMLSSVLKSRRAVQTNVEIMRAFVRLRRLIGHNRELARRLDALESKYYGQFRVVFDAIRELMAPPVPLRRRIGFVSGD